MSYDWWMSALEMVGDYGELTREQVARLGIHEGDAQPGFWRVPEPKRWLKEGDAPPEELVAIWQDDTGLHATCGGVPVLPAAVFEHCCRYPISEERFARAQRLGFAHLGAFRAGVTPRHAANC